jgi:hypothetical protein
MNLANAEHEGGVTGVVAHRLARGGQIDLFFASGPRESMIKSAWSTGTSPILNISIGPPLTAAGGRRVREVGGLVYARPVYFDTRRVDSTIHGVMRAISAIKEEFRTRMKLGKSARLRIVNTPRREETEAFGGQFFASDEDVTEHEVEMEIPIWRKKRENAARAIQKRWLPAYYNPRSRIGKARLLRQFSKNDLVLKELQKRGVRI